MDNVQDSQTLPGADRKKFIAPPNTRFTYSGIALDFLQEVIETTLGKKWEEIAQDFFTRAKMKSSTFKTKLSDDLLHNAPREVAKAHITTPDSNGALVPLPPLPDHEEVLAGTLHTTAEDYITFLQYCFKNQSLKSTLLEGIFFSSSSNLHRHITNPMGFGDGSLYR